MSKIIEDDRIRLSITIYSDGFPQLFAELKQRTRPARTRHLRSILLCRELDLVVKPMKKVVV